MQNSLRKAFVYRNVAGIIAEIKLIKIPLHMLTANPVVYAVDSTFAIIPPKGFNRVRICATTNIDAVSVINNMAFVSIPYKPISVPLIRVYSSRVLDFTLYWWC